jgi:hypothetical protein
MAAAALVFAGCSSTPEPAPASTVDSAFAVAWGWCLYAHPEPMTVKEDAGTEVLQPPTESCQRWLDKVGRDEFVEQWAEEYAQTYRCGFFVLDDTTKYPDEVDDCMDALK